MSDLTFVDKLDQEQLQNLNKIIDRAEALGIDPRLAASVAYSESNLRQRVKEGEKEPSILRGGAGEIGIMQIKPSTAKLMGFDEKQIMDTDANIDAGLKYLKQNIERYKDPMLGAMAYNTGPDHPFFLGKGEPSEQGLAYVNKIQSVGGFIPTAEKQKADDSVEVSEDNYRKYMMGLLGGLGGAAIGAKSSNVPSKDAIAQASKAGTPVQNWAASQGYQNRGAETYAKAHEAEMGTRKGSAIRSPATGQVFKPEFKVAKPPVIEPSALQRIGGASRALPVVGGALAGAGAGYGAQDASERYQKGDKLGAAIAGAGAIGSAVSMIPTLPTRVIGGGLAVASPAALMLIDRMRSAQPEQAQRMLTNVDPMGNPLP